MTYEAKVVRSSLQKRVEASLLNRTLPQGGLTDRRGGAFQVDSTVWAILALRSCGLSPDALERHCTVLADAQQADGRISISKDHPDSFWPTPLVVLAWLQSPSCEAALQQAVRFLLNTSGVHLPRKADAPWAHDTVLHGWPWVDETHSWIEPTALGITALRATGHGAHNRVQEAVQMLLNRQLPHGGWNYGNTLVFGKELHPMPESTGAALAGLSGMVKRDTVLPSLEYLRGEVARLQTPISLGWSLIGLASWDLWPSNGAALVERCLANQARYGEYDTAALSLLCLGALSEKHEGKPAFTPLHSTAQLPAATVQ